MTQQNNFFEMTSQFPMTSQHLPILPAALFCSIALIFSLGGVVLGEGTEPSPTTLTPIGGGEVLAEAFFNPAAGAIQHWSSNVEQFQGRVEQRWLSVDLAWQPGKGGQGPTLTKNFGNTEIAGFPELVLSAAFPIGTKITIRAKTDDGEFEKTFKAKVPHIDEFSLHLGSSKRLRQIKISVAKESKTPLSGYLLWMGFRNPAEAARDAEAWRRFSEAPLDTYIRKSPVPESMLPLYNILCAPEEIIRSRAAASPEMKNDKTWKADVPLTKNLAVANELIFGRKSEQDLDRNLVLKGEDGKRLTLVSAAQKAALSGNPHLLRESAQAAVRLALIPNWDVSFVTRFPGNEWDQRPFAQADLSYKLAVALDLTGSYMTPRGRELILRRLAEDAVGVINYTAWKHPYIFTGNQLAAFSAGRMASYAVLEKAFKHVAPYTDLAFAELKESIGSVIFPDGGSSEGSAYWAYAIETALPSFAIYARARQRPVEDLVRESFGNLDGYLGTLRSTALPNKLIMVGSGQGGPVSSVTSATLNMIARMKPEGTAASMLKDIGGFDKSLDLWSLPPASLEKAKAGYFPTFTLLPDTGLASSTRRLGDHLVKLLVVGGAHHSKGHASEDRGSFVLEFGGQTFAADPGGMTYSNVDAQAMNHAQRHNMLVPFGTAARAKPPFPPVSGVIPEATGDEKAFHATLNPGTCWPEHYKLWKRIFNSPDPARIEIVDEFELKQGKGVDFLWQTPLPVEERDGRVHIRGEKGEVVITPPEGATITIGTPWEATGWKMTPVTFRVEKTAGRITTLVEIVPKEIPPPENSTP